MKGKVMARPTIVQTPDGRVFVKHAGRHPLAPKKVRLLSPDEVSKYPTLPGAEDVEALPAEQGVPTYLPQSVIEPVPRSVVDPTRRTAYPQRSEKTKAMQESMTPQEYLKKKTFERPGFFAIEDPIQTANPWEGSVLLAGPSGTAVVGNLKITSEADFEAVKIMVLGRKFVDQAWLSTKNFLINFKDLASGRDLNNVPIHAENFGGSANEPLILPVTLFMNRNSAVTVEFTNVEPVSTDIYLYYTMLGIKYYYPSALNLTTGIPEEGEWKRM